MLNIWRKMLLAAGVLLTLFAVYMLVGPDTRKTALLKRLETEGVVAQAKVLAKHVEDHVSYDDSGSRAGRRSAGSIIRDHNRRADSATVTHLYYVDVEFKTAQGRTVSSKKEVLGQYFDGITVGAQVPILYHPEGPAEVSRLRDHASPYPDVSGIYRIMAMFSLAIAAILLWWGRPRGDEAIESRDREWQAAASNRMTNGRGPRSGALPVPARGIGAGQSAAPKGFGRSRRSART